LLPVSYLSHSASVGRGGGSADDVDTLHRGGALSGVAFPPSALPLVEESWLVFLVSPE